MENKKNIRDLQWNTRDKIKILSTKLLEIFKSSNVHIDSIESAIAKKQSFIKKVNPVIKELVEIVKSTPKSLRGTIASYVSYAFRSKNDVLGSFIMDLDGVNNEPEEDINNLIKSLLVSLIDLLKENDDYLSALKILDSLKWIFRKKEITCVAEIDL